MNRSRIIIMAALALAASPAFAEKIVDLAPAPAAMMRPAAGDKTWSVKAQGVASLKGVSKDEAREAALLDAKKKAVLAYVSLNTPPTIIAEHEEELDQLVARPDQWVSSWEVENERTEAGSWIVDIEADLDLVKLAPALKTIRLLPARAMPQVFVAAAGKIGAEPMKSGWNKAAEARGRFNVCEAAIVARLEKYGFPAFPPAAGQSAGDVSRIINPGGEEEKKQLYSELRDKFGAGAMVVGLADAGTESAAPPKKDKVSTRVSIKIAAADVEKGEVVFNDEVTTVFETRGIPFREEQMAAVCGEAGEKAAAALFRAFTPRFQPGQERQISLTVRGISSYPAMKDLELKLGEEGPGVKAVELARMGAGEIEFKVTTTAATDVVAQWLAQNRFQAGRLEVTGQDEQSIKAKVKGTP
ncbi:MAG TPA: hypothetical protein VM658_02360 [bacterium]|nr:hypothetical protein [bacterium]